MILSHPELSRITLHKGVDLPYVVWLVLRHYVVSENHSSHFTTTNARHVCMTFGLNFTKRHWNRIWHDGDTIFWGMGNKTIHLRSFKRVYNLLADTTATNIPYAQFVPILVHKSSQLRRAELYLSWFVSRGEITISRATITELFGVSEQQQRAYEKLVSDRLLIKTNYCHISAQEYAKNPKLLPEHYYTFIQEKFADDTITYQDVIAYQMPNTFISSVAHNAKAATRASSRCKNVVRTLYRHTPSLYTTKRYNMFLRNEFDIVDTGEYVRKYFQGSKRIHRIGHYL